MRIILICFLSTLLGCNESNAQVSETNKKVTGTIDNTSVHLKRSNLVVADIERTLEIYRDILGFMVYGDIRELESDSDSYIVFKIPKHAKLRSCYLSSQSEERTLALTEVKGIALPKPSTPLTSALVIRVEDVVEVMKKIANLGLETSKLKVLESEDYVFKEQAFTDFDGHLVVVYQIIQTTKK